MERLAKDVVVSVEWSRCLSALSVTLQKGKRGKPRQRSATYLVMPDDPKKGVANITEDERNCVIKCCSLMADISVKTGVYVDDDEEDGEDEKEGWMGGSTEFYMQAYYDEATDYYFPGAELE